MVDIDPIIQGIVKFRDGKKWKTRWCIMRKLSPVADCLHLQLYKDSRDQLKLCTTKASLSLQTFLGFESGFTLDKESNTIAIICKDVIVVLAFDTRERLIQWEVKVTTHLGDDFEFVGFLASVPPKSKMQIGPTRMHIQNRIFCLTTGVPSKLVGFWDIAHLRRYGVVDKRFCFEGGSRCGKGEGLYVFMTDQGDSITNTMKLAAEEKLGNGKGREKSDRFAEHWTEPVSIKKNLEDEIRGICHFTQDYGSRLSLCSSQGSGKYCNCFHETASMSELNAISTRKDTECHSVDLERYINDSSNAANPLSRCPSVIGRKKGIDMSQSCNLAIGRNCLKEAMDEVSICSSQGSSVGNESIGSSQYSVPKKFLCIEKLHENCRKCHLTSINNRENVAQHTCHSMTKEFANPSTTQTTIQENEPRKRILTNHINQFSNYDIPRAVSRADHTFHNYDTPRSIGEGALTDTILLRDKNVAIKNSNTECLCTCSDVSEKLVARADAPKKCACNTVMSWAEGWNPLRFCRRSSIEETLNVGQPKYKLDGKGKMPLMNAKIDSVNFQQNISFSMESKTEEQIKNDETITSNYIDCSRMTRSNHIIPITKNYANLQFSKSPVNYENIYQISLKPKVDSKDELKHETTPLKFSAYVNMYPVLVHTYSKTLPSKKFAYHHKWQGRSESNLCLRGEIKRNEHTENETLSEKQAYVGIEKNSILKLVSANNGLSEYDSQVAIVASATCRDDSDDEISCHSTSCSRTESVLLRRSCSVAYKDQKRDSSTSNDSGVSTGSNCGGKSSICHSANKWRSHISFKANTLPKRSNLENPFQDIAFRFSKKSSFKKSSSAEARVSGLKHSKTDAGVENSFTISRQPVDKKSLSSETSDISDYIESLSLSSHGSMDTSDRLRLATCKLRPRSGKEYKSIDRLTISEPANISQTKFKKPLGE